MAANSVAHKQKVLVVNSTNNPLMHSCVCVQTLMRESVDEGEDYAMDGDKLHLS